MCGTKRSAKSGGASYLNNPAGIPSNAITESEFLYLRGVGDALSGAGIDRIGGANLTRLSEKQRARTKQELMNEADAYYDRRAAARQEYKELVESGKIRDKTTIEKMLTTAHGNPDNASTQAARRMAKKRGIDWRTGKKLKENN